MRRVGLVAGVVLAVALLAGCTDPNAEACEAAGGKVDSKTDTGVGIGSGSGGAPVTVVTTSTTYFCILDGEVTDIW